MRLEDIVERVVTAVVLGTIAIVLVLGLLGALGCHFHLHVGEKHQYTRCKEATRHEEDTGVLDDLAIFERLAHEANSAGADNQGGDPGH